MSFRVVQSFDQSIDSVRLDLQERNLRLREAELSNAWDAHNLDRSRRLVELDFLSRVAPAPITETRVIESVVEPRPLELTTVRTITRPVLPTTTIVTSRPSCVRTSTVVVDTPLRRTSYRVAVDLPSAEAGYRSALRSRIAAQSNAILEAQRDIADSHLRDVSHVALRPTVTSVSYF